MMTPFLVGERLDLRVLEESDMDGEYPRWLNDEDACRGNSHHRYPYTRDDALEFVRRTRGARDQLVLAMVLRENDQHFGNIALTHIDTVRRSAEFAILVGEKNFWSKGYGEEAGRLLLDHGFFTLNLHRICCGTFSTNVGMQRLAEKLGMQLEGRRREAAFKDNQWLDILEYGVLREEHVERFGQPARG